MPACAAVSLGLLSCGDVIGSDCRRQHAASTVLLYTNPGALLQRNGRNATKLFARGEDQNKKDMKSLREAVEELGKDLQTLTTAVQELTSQLTQKAKPVIPRPPRLRAIRER